MNIPRIYDDITLKTVRMAEESDYFNSKLKVCSEGYKRWLGVDIEHTLQGDAESRVLFHIGSQ